MTANPDRARSRLQQMTNKQLWKLADKHHVDKTERGRNTTRKRLIMRLMLTDSVIEELGVDETKA